MKHCTNCVMPNTKPDLHFDSAGVCDACRSAERKDNQVNWDERRKLFEKTIAPFKGNKHGYDCVIPVSGGKDSTYQVIMALEYGLKPLCVSFEPTVPTELGKQNLANINKLGVDLIQFRKNPEVYREMCRIGFLRVGDNEWPNHVGIFTVPIRAAINYKIPLIIWGENPQLEYGGPPKSTESNILDRRWLEEFGGLLGYRVSDMEAEGIDRRDLTPYIYPEESELKEAGITSIFLGYYFKWDARAQLKRVMEAGFKCKEDGPVEGTFTNYENLDCALPGVHDYLKFVKFGFGRATDHACLDVRNHRITRDQAVDLVREYDGRYPYISMKDCIDYLGITKAEFDKIVDSFTNKKIFELDENRNFKRDPAGNLILKYPVKKAAELIGFEAEQSVTVR